MGKTEKKFGRVPRGVAARLLEALSRVGQSTEVFTWIDSASWSCIGHEK